MGRMGIHMGDRRRLARGAGRCHGSRLASRSRSGMRGESSLPASPHTCLALHPRSQNSHGIARTTIVAADLFKQRQNPLRTVSGFQCQGVVNR
jgi:hypothetical protein